MSHVPHTIRPGEAVKRRRVASGRFPFKPLPKLDELQRLRPMFHLLQIQRWHLQLIDASRIPELLFGHWRKITATPAFECFMFAVPKQSPILVVLSSVHVVLAEL